MTAVAVTTLIVAGAYTARVVRCLWNERRALRRML